MYSINGVQRRCPYKMNSANLSVGVELNYGELGIRIADMPDHNRNFGTRFQYTTSSPSIALSSIPNLSKAKTNRPRSNCLRYFIIFARA